MKILLLIGSISLLISGCLSKKIFTAGKVQDSLTTTYQKILVAGIIKDKNDSLKSKVDKELLKNLKEIGYTAVGIKKNLVQKDYPI